MKIAMVTMVTPAVAELEPSIPNKQDYCAAQGHALVVGREVLDATRHPVWTKMHLLKRHLPDYDWLFWSDADAVVTDFGRSLGGVLQQARSLGEADLYVAKDRFGMNFGHFFLRNCPGSFRLIDLALARTDTLAHTWQEQEAVVRILRETPDVLRVAYVPQRLFNSYPAEMNCGAAWRPGDFICHCPGEGKHLFPTLLGLPNIHVGGRGAFGDLWTALGYRGEGVEVGVAGGDLSRAIRETWSCGRLHLVDRWAHVPGYLDRMNADDTAQERLYVQVRKRFASDPAVTIHRASSLAAAARFADASLDWVYLDADHSYESVSADLRAWWPKVRVGGMLAGHDFVPDGDRPEGRFGVTRAVFEFLPTVGLQPAPYVTSEPDWPSWYVIRRP